MAFHFDPADPSHNAQASTDKVVTHRPSQYGLNKHSDILQAQAQTQKPVHNTG